MRSATAPIQRVKVIDDDPQVRSAYSFSIEAADFEAVPEDGPLGSLESYLQRPRVSDAAISDYRLRPNGYADFDGARLLRSWYEQSFPAILCTTFDKSNSTEFRSLRRWLPVVMSPEQLSPDSLLGAFEVIQREFLDDFLPERRPWRALVHFIEYDKDSRTVKAKLPGWGPEAVSFRLVDLPNTLQRRIPRHPDLRCHAVANLGALSNDELYVADWEI